MRIFDYTDYRQFLKDTYAELKSKGRQFSFRYFAKMAGLSSSGYLKMVMDGERNLSANSINQFAKALKLSAKEADYFETLVLLNQSKAETERDFYLTRLSALKPVATLTGIAKDQFEYFTQNHYVVIREMVALPDFTEEATWIAERISPPIKPKDVVTAIEALLRLGLLVRNAAGKLVQRDASLSTAAEVSSLEVFQFHRGMLDAAKSALMTVSSDRRDVTSLTIPVPIATMGLIKEKIQALREDIIALINRGSADYTEVFQLNIQLFPVTSAEKKPMARKQTGKRS